MRLSERGHKSSPTLQDFAAESISLDISYTKAPHWVGFGGGDWGVRMWSLAGAHSDYEHIDSNR